MGGFTVQLNGSFHQEKLDRISCTIFPLNLTLVSATGSISGSPPIVFLNLGYGEIYYSPHLPVTVTATGYTATCNFPCPCWSGGANGTGALSLQVDCAARAVTVSGWCGYPDGHVSCASPMHPLAGVFSGSGGY